MMTYDRFDLSGKTAVITGGNGGIGLGFARAISAAEQMLAYGEPTLTRTPLH